MLPRAIKYKLFEIFPNIGFVPSTAAKQQVSHATPSCGAFTAHIYHSIHDPTNIRPSKVCTTQLKCISKKLLFFVYFYFLRECGYRTRDSTLCTLLLYSSSVLFCPVLNCIEPEQAWNDHFRLLPEQAGGDLFQPDGRSRPEPTSFGCSQKRPFSAIAGAGQNRPFLAVAGVGRKRPFSAV